MKNRQSKIEYHGHTKLNSPAIPIKGFIQKIYPVSLIITGMCAGMLGEHDRVHNSTFIPGKNLLWGPLVRRKRRVPFKEEKDVKLE